MSSHSSDVLASFLNGEPRLIAAAWRDGRDGLFVLPENAATQHRTLARSDLMCFVPGCPSPELTTVHRTRARDGFRHLASGVGQHAGEGIHHQQAKYALADWLRSQAPHASAQVERASDERRTRVADVMLTPDNGQLRIAFEIQYAALTPEEWQRRHRSYVAQGIVDVWLFGHQGRQLRVHAADSTVQISSLHAAVVNAGLPLLWFNPYSMQLATAATMQTVALPIAEVFPGLPGVDHDVALRVEDLTEARVDPLYGLSSPVIGALQAATDRVRPIVEQRARDEALHRSAAASAKRAAEDELRRRTEEWLSSADYQRRLDLLGGRWPAELDQQSRTKISWPTSMWQSDLWEKFVLNRGVSATFSTDDLAAHLQSLVQPHSLAPYHAYHLSYAWATGLRKAGLLRSSGMHHRFTGIPNVHFEVVRISFAHRATSRTPLVDSLLQH